MADRIVVGLLVLAGVLLAWLAADVSAARHCALEEQGTWVGTIGVGGYCRRDR